MPSTNEDNPEFTTPPEGGHKRRPRYRGTHPRRFQERYKELQPQKFPEMVDHIRAQGRTPAGTHVPIMLAEVMECLSPAAGEMVADCTLGYGGHAGEFLKRIGPAGRLVGMDVDGQQLERTRQRLLDLGTGAAISTHRGNFAGIGNLIAKEGIDGFDVIFADLGVSSMQLDDPQRGFSYKHDGPLDMRMDSRLKITAASIVNTAKLAEIETALVELGDEEDGRRIARAIVHQRAERPFSRTGELAELILHVKGITVKEIRQSGNPHPATKTFQALRIIVNDELGSLRQLLRNLPYCLKSGGRAAILTFHSGEDRLVKKAFEDCVAAGLCDQCNSDVIRASATEVASNPRASSAKLRWCRRG